ncbi:MAG: GNAT family N-acetyltransferase [Alphaproteobacteria bacterium]
MLDLILQAFDYMNARIDPPSSALRMTPASIAADAAKGTLLLAERDADLVGCVFCTPQDDVLYVGKLAVRPGLQGQGIGKQLMAAAEAEARAQAFAFMELGTRVELTENLATFAKLGFVKHADFTHDGYDRPTSVTLRKRL